MSLNRVEHKVNHSLVKYITEEQLSILDDPASLISEPHGNFNYIVITPCLKNYNNWKSDFYWGDYISYTNPGMIGAIGVNNQQLLSNLNYFLYHLSDDGCYNVHVFYISAQKYNFDYLKKDNFTYVELDEYYGEYWSIFEHLQPEFSENLDYTEKEFHFCNLNYRADLFRQKWFYEILNNDQLKKSTIFSYYCCRRNNYLTRNIRIEKENTIDYKFFSKYHYEAGNLDNPEDYISLLPYYANKTQDLEINDNGSMVGWALPDQVSKKSIFCIVNETYFDVPYDPIFTEKTFKPIFNKMPFLLFGSAGSLKKLKSLGFKTFSNIIDESYDLELDPQRRFSMIVKESNRLTNIPISDIIQMVKTIEPILSHNRERLKELKSELSNKINQIDKLILTYVDSSTV